MKIYPFLALLLAPALTVAQSLALVSGNDYQPYSDSQLPGGGLSTELVKESFAAMHQDITVQWRPWARRQVEALKGAFAGTFPYAKNAEREQRFLFSDPIQNIKSHAFIKAGTSKLNFADLTGLEGTTYCVPLGWQVNRKLAAMVDSGQIRLERPQRLDNCIKMLAAGRVDFFTTNESGAWQTIRTSRVPEGSVVMASGPPLDEIALFFIAAKNVATSADVIQTFNAGLKSIKKSGVYDRVVKSHLNL